MHNVNGKPTTPSAEVVPHSDEKGQPLSISELRGGFDGARVKAGVSFQFRDLRAKAATDTEDLHHAQKLLGHTTRAMTENYTRKRIDDTVKPVGAKPENK